ncbi:hypothetical protein PMAYCL1PPCAC_04926, partial [Pristionchus mayeri]
IRMLDNSVSKWMGGAAAVVLPSAAFLLWRQWAKKECNDEKKVPLNGEKRSLQEKFFFVEEQFVGVVLGKQLRHLRRIEMETKTFLNLVAYGRHELSHNARAAAAYEGRERGDDEEERPKGGNLHFIKIIGQTKEQIQLAEMAIDGMIIDAKRRKGTEAMKVPASSIGMIIGRQGVMIKKIGRLFRVRVRIDQEGNDFETVILEGTPDGIAEAKTYILRLVDDSSNADFGEERGVDEEIKEIIDLKEKLETVEEMW